MVKNASSLAELLQIFDGIVADYRNAASLLLAESGSTAKTARLQPKKNFAEARPSNPSPDLNATPTPKPFANSQSTLASGQHQSTPSSAPGHKKVKKISKVKASDDEVIVLDQGILDSGSSVHTVPSDKYLTSSVKSIDSADRRLLAANDSEIFVLGQGDSLLSPNIPLSNVLVTPDIIRPIVSPQLLIKDSNSSILLSSNKAYLVSDSIPNNNSISNLIKESTCIAHLDPLDNLYKTHPPTSSPSPVMINTVRRNATVSFKTLAEEVSFWHSALGHTDVEVMVQTFNKPVFRKSHPHITSAIIRKYFPKSFPDCPFANL
jgi:hypothetical protein